MSRSRVQDPVQTPDFQESERAMREPRVDGARTQPQHDDFEGSAAVATDPSDERASIFAVMGGSTRKGSWEPAEHNEVIAIMGGVNLDFREADLLEGTTTVRCFTMMGGISIVVPPDVDIDVNGIGLLGRFDHVDHRATEDDVPCLKIEGIALMGRVSVRVKERVDLTDEEH